MFKTSNPVVSREWVIAVTLLTTAVVGWLFWNRPTEANSIAPAANAETLIVWPDSATEKQLLQIGKEYDTTALTSDLIAGKRVQRITNVSKAELHFWPAASESNTGTSVIICPGGGFYILAWDLEGTEIAQWLNSIGVNAFILKYRVPTAKDDDPAAGPTEDLQRAIALVRHNADKWNLDKDRIGTLGFSAGGNVIANAAFTSKRYTAIDDVDQQSTRANFIVPIYGARMVAKDGGLRDGMTLQKDSPPAFIVHAIDDFCPVENALELASLYAEAGASVECHVFDAGGHGFGARRVKGVPATDWPRLCEAWMRKNGWLESK